MKNLLYFYTVLFSVVFLSSCQKSDHMKPDADLSLAENQYPSDTTAINLIDQTYGKDELQTYDMHLPAKRSYNKTKVIILLHGGAWRKLDKSYMNNCVKEIKENGDNWVIVNANYRLTFQDSVTYEQQMEDIDALVNNVVSLRKKYNYSDKIYLSGISSGGHLALAYAFSVDKSRYIKGVSAITPPSDLTTEEIRKSELGKDIEKLIGKTYKDAPDLYRKASPRFYVSRLAPPVILFYGGKDTTIPLEQGVLMSQQLKANSVVCSYNFYADQTHDWSRLTEAMEKTLAFFGDKK